jgi:hypothetical protein
MVRPDRPTAVDRHLATEHKAIKVGAKTCDFLANLVVRQLIGCIKLVALIYHNDQAARLCTDIGCTCHKFVVQELQLGEMRGGMRIGHINVNYEHRLPSKGAVWDGGASN